MSETVTLYPTASVKVSGIDPYYREQGAGQVELKGGREHMLVNNGFAVPAAYAYRPIAAATVAAYGYGISVAGWGLPYCSFAALYAPADLSTVTAADLPAIDNIGSAQFAAAQGYLTEDISPQYFTPKLRRIIDNGLVLLLSQERTLDTSGDAYTAYVQTAYGSNKPYLRLEFGEGQCSKVIRDTAPVSRARLNRALPAKFEATLKNSIDTSLRAPDVASVTLRLRAKGATAYAEVDFGSATSKAVAGNLLPSGAFEYQFAVTDSAGGSSTSAWVELASYIELTTSRSPAAGAFADRTKPQLFSWTTVAGASVTKFRLRAKDAEEYAEYTVADSAAGYTLAANIMGSGEYEWTIAGVDQYGVESAAEWMALDTTDAISSAAPVSPSGTMVDADDPIIFAWQHIIATGSSQTKAEIQTSADGETWADLVTVTGAETETAVAAGKLAGGTWWWRVRTYNLDNVAGTWSAAAQFVAIASPATPKLTVKDASPRPIVEWQAEEQEAYELTLDGESTTAYGTGKRWTCPRYLDDGTHTVSVRVQNSYGRWSKPGTVELTVSNSPGAGVSLRAQGEGAAVRLSWESSGYDDYLVYRDGIVIARITGMEHLDYFACGAHTYTVRGCYADRNNYGISAPVVVEAYPPCPVIIDVKTHEAVWLELSEQQHRTYGVSRARQSASYHVAGRALPSTDVSEFVDETLTVSAAFWAEDRAGMRALEALLGRMVCLKTDSGEMATGVLSAVAKTAGMFYTSYQLAVTNTDLEEAIPE